MKNTTESKKLVLLIDDENDMDWIMSRILTDAGYELITAKTGADGLDKFRRDYKSILLVILDLRLPDMDGVDLLRQIKKISSKTKVLMITAYGTSESTKLAKRAGALDVLDKPFRVEKILKAARLAFEGAGII